eukprot:SAG22_NODE_15376_length_350_cov_0.812749_1_plen_68_part_10
MAVPHTVVAQLGCSPCLRPLVLPRRAAAALLPRRVTGRAVWSCEEWVGVAVGWLRECGERERRRQVCA